VDWGFAGMDFVLKSEEWARPGGCKRDRFAFMYNGDSLISSTRNVSICDVPFFGTTSVYANWRIVPFDNQHAYWHNAPYSIHDDDCPLTSSGNFKGDRVDFQVRLQDSGDGRYPTTVYIGTRSVFNSYCT
jgi:hypothetical protein